MREPRWERILGTPVAKGRKGSSHGRSWPTSEAPPGPRFPADRRHTPSSPPPGNGCTRRCHDIRPYRIPSASDPRRLAVPRPGPASAVKCRPSAEPPWPRSALRKLRSACEFLCCVSSSCLSSVRDLRSLGIPIHGSEPCFLLLVSALSCCLVQRLCSRSLVTPIKTNIGPVWLHRRLSNLLNKLARPSLQTPSSVHVTGNPGGSG
jgi:hypothetical protein